MLRYLLDDEVELDEKSVAKILQKDGKKARTALVEGRKVLAECAWDIESIEAALRELLVKLDAKPRFVFQPIRVAVCGNQVSPPLFESIALLDRDVVDKRLAKAIEVAVD